MKNDFLASLLVSIDQIDGKVNELKEELNCVRNKLSDEQKSTKHFVKLTGNEQEVLYLISEGYTNAMISKKLFRSIRTIETNRKHLLEKTGTTNTATLIRFAIEQKLIE